MFLIRLHDIPAEGREYRYSRATGELDQDLQDLLGTSEYETQFRITPVGGAYEIRGTWKSESQLVCSTCGWDLPWLLQKSFHGYLTEQTAAQRGDQGVHGSESMDLGETNEGYGTFRGDTFDAGQYFREFVALSEPSYPTCEDPVCPRKSETEARLRELAQQAEKEFHPTSPFAVLEKIRSRVQ